MKRPFLFAAVTALVCAGAAAGYGVSTIYLKPGGCTKVAKTRVCARKVPPVTVTVVSQVGRTVKGDGAETLAPITLAHGVEVRWTSQPDSMGFNIFSAYSSPSDTTQINFDSGASGESYIGPGTYTLSVVASGVWTMSF